MNEKHLSNIKLDKKVDYTALAKLKKQDSKTFNFHCVKVSVFGVFLVRIFPYHSVSLHIQSECEKLRTRKTPNTDTFHAAFIFQRLIIKDFVLTFSIKIILLKQWNQIQSKESK